MIFVRPFAKEDLDGLDSLDVISALDIAQAIEETGHAATGVRNGKVVCCGGVYPMSDQHGMLWMRLGSDCLRYKIEIIRFICETLKVFEEVFEFKYLESWARSNFKEAVKLIEFLGFRKTRTENGWNVYSKRID